MENENIYLLEQICFAANTALLYYANNQHELAAMPRLSAFVGEPEKLRAQKTQHTLQLKKTVKAYPYCRYARLLQLLGEDEAGILARQTLELAILAHCNPFVEPLLQELSLGSAPGVSIELAVRVYMNGDKSAAGAGVSHFFLCSEAYEALSLLMQTSEGAEACYRKQLVADARLIAWLAGDDDLDERLRSIAYRQGYDPIADPPELFDREDLPEKLAAALFPENRAGIVLLRGDQGSGRRLLLHHAAQLSKRDILYADCRVISALGAQQQTAIRLLLREATLCRAIVCWCDYDPQNFSSSEFIRQCVQPLLRHEIAQCVTTLPDVEFGAAFGVPVSRFSLPELDRSGRIRMWEGFTAQRGLKLDCLKYGVRYRLRPAEIQLAIDQLVQMRDEGTTITDALVSQVCIDVLPPSAHGSLRQVKSGYCFEDLKLPEDQKKVLKDICGHIWYSHTVYDEWGLESRFPYGRGVTALFTGAPGTGKTMAAHVISQMLDIPLYRVDISAIVDKYIGETEKHLEKIFGMAEKSNTILFFDEADAIFGKRSEVSDSKDKYANTETSYILQRIEQYDGIVILASNYRRNIDEAFLRRMRYVVDFQLPNSDIRREIWKSCFADETPMEGIDFDFLARKFELSGGNIKNIALTAAFAAASENSAINMGHLLRAIRAENLKTGKTMIASDFENYCYLL